MQILRLGVTVNILLMVKFFDRIPLMAEAQSFPFEKPFVGFATGTLTSKILDKILNVGEQEKPKCALSLNNQLTSYRLVDPLLYVGHGENPMPVPLKVDTNSTVETSFEAAAEGKDTSGLLFYKIETTGHYLRIFWKISGPSMRKTYTPNRFDVEIIQPQKFTDDEKSLEKLYGDLKAYSESKTDASDFTVTETLVRVSGRSAINDPLKITIRAQMTTEKDGKLTVSVNDNLSPAVPTLLQKRVVSGTMIGLSLMSTVLGVVFRKIMKHIPKEQTGTISLENKSKEMLLINPSWFITGGHTSSIVPWDIKPTEKGTISWISPLAGTKILEMFTYTVYFLSYQIEGTNYHVVAGTWFPFKLGPGQSVFTLFVIEKNIEAQTMKNILSIVGQVLAEKKGDINQLTSAIKSNPQQKFILNDIPDKTIHGFRSSKYQRYYEWQYPIFTPQVRLKKGTEYHVKIVAAVGFGKALGVDIKVEVVPGASPQAASFKKKNPQNYIEPPSGKTLTSQATTTMLSDWPKTSTNQEQENLQSTNRNSPAVLSTSDTNDLQSTVDENFPRVGGAIAPATLPNDIPTSENSLDAMTTDLETDAMVLRKSATARKILAAAKKIPAAVKKSGKPSMGRVMQHIAWRKRNEKTWPNTPK